MTRLNSLTVGLTSLTTGLNSLTVGLNSLTTDPTLLTVSPTLLTTDPTLLMVDPTLLTTDLPPLTVRLNSLTTDPTLLMIDPTPLKRPPQSTGLLLRLFRASQTGPQTIPCRCSAPLPTLNRSAVGKHFRLPRGNMDAGQLALLIPIVAIGAGAFVRVAKIKAASHTAVQDPDTANRLAALEDDVARLRGELAETHERLDFTERLLAQHRPGELGK